MSTWLVLLVVVAVAVLNWLLGLIPGNTGVFKQLITGVLVIIAVVAVVVWFLGLLGHAVPGKLF